MKKGAWAAAAAVMVLFNAAVFADANASYTGAEGNAATVSGAGSYETICITRGDGNVITADNLVYINQAEDVYSGSTSFMLRNNPAPGKYKVWLGTASGALTPTYFYIMEAKEADTSMAYRRGADGSGI